MELTFTVEDVIKASGIHPLKVRNVYLYGSRVYQNASEDSDYDIIMVAGHLMVHEEKRVTLNGKLLNIHIITPDKFLADLKLHNIMNLECLFAPSWAILQEKIPLPFDINLKRLIKNNLAQSYSSWNGGKMKLEKYDIHRGIKSIFHSMRMLMFAIQIAEHGKIVNFSEGNELSKELVECDEFEWDYFKETYFKRKVDLEEKLKSFAKAENPAD